MAEVLLLPDLVLSLVVMTESTSLGFRLVISQVKSSISLRFSVVLLLLNFNSGDNEFRLLRRTQLLVESLHLSHFEYLLRTRL